MGNVMIINASPRAPRSNSKEYASLFSSYSQMPTEYYAVKKVNHMDLCRAMENFTDVLFVFPLYADSLPVTLLHFLKTLEQNPPQHKPVVSAVINCGFIEPQQNDIAVEILQEYCRANGYSFGSVLKIGGGEAILTTPFRVLVKTKMRRLAAAINKKRCRTLAVTMPLPKRMFLRASSSYWENYGRKNGITRAEMETMDIES